MTNAMSLTCNRLPNPEYESIVIIITDINMNKGICLFIVKC